MNKKTKISILLLALATVVVGGSSVQAALTDSTNFSQSIGVGTLSTFIGDASGDEVVSPSVAFDALAVSNAVQTSTGTFGTNTERIYVDNPGASATGWNLTFAATGGASAAWTSGGNDYAFNGATSDDGQLTVDPSTGTINDVIGGTTSITTGSTATFSGGTNTPITLMSAAAGAADIGLVYLTGVSLSQTIPASTPAGSYTLDFTQTVVGV